MLMIVFAHDFIGVCVCMQLSVGFHAQARAQRQVRAINCILLQTLSTRLKETEEVNTKLEIEMRVTR